MSDQSVRRLKPLIVHPLPAAPTFTGRKAELSQLREFWSERSGVLSLIGLGGAGKTALTRHFVDLIQADDSPDGLFVWSFYDEPDANAFLQTAYTYFTGGRTADAKGAGWFHLLKEALSDGGRYVIVLDGLERVQRQQTDATGIYGEMEDPLLRGFLTRIAAGSGEAKAIITSRFPIADLEKWRGRGYTLIDVNPLEKESGRALLRAHGVQGDDGMLDMLMESYGGHALTLDLLGGALTRFFDGNPARIQAFAARGAAEGVPQDRRLSEVLGIYEKLMPARELALLCRLCIFRFGVDAEALESIFLGLDKEGIAGELAGCTAEELQNDLDDLVQRHLTSQDARGKYTMHPAVRDYFYGLFNEPEKLHAAVRQHLSSLSNRPGLGPASDKTTLDLLEELIYHAIQSGNTREAEEIYRHRMGGNDFLNAELGEYVRTYRILRAFPECPDKSAMYHCLRAFGRYDDALAWRPKNAYIRLMQARLHELSADPADTTRRMAWFLNGRSVHLPERSSDFPVPVALLHLYRGDVEEARTAAENEVAVSLYKDDIARNKLILAECARRDGHLQRATELLDTASRWVLHSGSQEHLALMHLVRARIALDDKHIATAQAAIEEGLHTVQESDFVLLELDLLIEQARVYLDEGHLENAARYAQKAVDKAQNPDVGLVWAEAAAGQLLGEILKRMDRNTESIHVFEQTLALRKRIGDPNAVWTERALRSMAVTPTF
jgi:tetratricopeptide (TPR) repeat protein